MRDRLLLAALETEVTVEAAQAVVESLDGAGRNRQLADLLIERHACAACHDIPGHARPEPRAGGLGTATSTAAVGWLAALGAEPGAGDGPDALDLEAFHAGVPGVGVFGLTVEEARVLEASRLELPDRASAGVAAGSAGALAAGALAAGRNVLERHACRACHVIESAGGHLGPSLDRAAPRLRSGWVTAVLTGEAPPARPWQGVRMPSFDLNAREVDAVVDHFATRAGLARTAAVVPTPGARDRAVGRAVFEVLQCGRCHGTGAQAAVVGSDDEDGREGLLPVHLAPDYRLSRQRLRPAWLRAYLLEPRRLDPASTVPEIFPALGGGQFESSYLLGSLSTPMFQLQRLRLMRHFEDDVELEQHFSEPRHVAAGLAAYLEALRPAASGGGL